MSNKDSRKTKEEYIKNVNKLIDQFNKTYGKRLKQVKINLKQ